MRFRNRRTAGSLLAKALGHLAHQEPIVLAVPRGGVAVAFEIARELAAPLDVIIARKLGAPMDPELGIGAVAEGGVVLVNEGLRRRLAITDEELDEVIHQERVEVARRVNRYRGGRALDSLAGKAVILVDDGVATGGTALAAVRAARELGADRIVFATPVCATEAAQELRLAADELVALSIPHELGAIGAWYVDFAQVDERDVRMLLAGEQPLEPAELGIADPAIRVPVAGGFLRGMVALPTNTRALILFAHASGSSRHSPRNRSLAAALQSAGLGTVLIDLLTEDEGRFDECSGAFRFKIPMLAERVEKIVDWIARDPLTAHLRLGCFGASSGAAAALLAAAHRPERISAIVSRGGRPDLVGGALALVRAPTLLIVGGEDHLLELNRSAMHAMRCDRELAIIPGASHLLEEEGALEKASELAAAWFLRHLHIADAVQPAGP